MTNVMCKHGFVRETADSAACPDCAKASGDALFAAFAPPVASLPEAKGAPDFAQAQLDALIARLAKKLDMEADQRTVLGNPLALCHAHAAKYDMDFENQPPAIPSGVPSDPPTPVGFVRIGDYSVSETIGGSFLLVDETEEFAPIARFTCETDARAFWRFVEALATYCVPDAASEIPSIMSDSRDWMVRRAEMLDRMADDEESKFTQDDLYVPNGIPTALRSISKYLRRQALTLAAPSHQGEASVPLSIADEAFDYRSVAAEQRRDEPASESVLFFRADELTALRDRAPQIADDLARAASAIRSEARVLREAEEYIAALRAPLLEYFGTTDPALLAEVFADRATRAEDVFRIVPTNGGGDELRFSVAKLSLLSITERTNLARRLIEGNTGTHTATRVLATTSESQKPKR